MGRLMGWETKLIKALKERSQTPWKWGEHDCVQFSAFIIRSFTDHDFALPAYKSERQAYKIIHQNYDGDLRNAVDCFFRRKGIKMLKRGDLVCKESNGDYSLGVFVGNGAAFATDIGYTIVPKSKLSNGWEI